MGNDVNNTECRRYNDIRVNRAVKILCALLCQRWTPLPGIFRYVAGIYNRAPGFAGIAGNDNKFKKKYLEKKPIPGAIPA